MTEDQYRHLYELWRASEACLRAIGIPNMLGGPDLPPEVNRLIGATYLVRNDHLEAPAGWQEPTAAPSNQGPF